jgi:hypothetical protein
MEKKSPLHVAKRCDGRHRRRICHGCGGTALVDYSLVALQLTRKGLPVTKAPLAVEIPLIAS